MRNRIFSSLAASACAFALTLFAVPSADAAPQAARVDGEQFNALRAPMERNARVRIQNVPLLDREPETLELERFDVWAPNAEIQVLGEGNKVVEKLPIPTTRYFRGTVAGDAGSVVFLAVDGDNVRGIIETELRRFALGTVVRRGKDRVASGFEVTVEDVPVTTDHPEGGGFTCDVEGQQVVPRAQSLTDALPFAPRSEAALSASPNALWALNLAIVTDYELYTKTNNSATDVTTFVGTLVGAGSVIYKRDLDTELLVSSLNVHSVIGDPFTINPGSSGTWNSVGGVTYTTSHALAEFGDYWHNTPPSANPRSSAVLLSGKNQTAGVAWIGTICGGDFQCSGGNCGDALFNGHYAGGYAYCGGIDPPADLAVPNPDANVNYQAPSTNYWPLLQFAHELGHNVGSGHTHCIELSAPDKVTYGRDYVDHCVNGCQAGSTSVPVEKGTIMSYCHLSGGTQTRFTFGQSGEASYVVPEAMRADIQAVTPALSTITAPASVAPAASANASVTAVGGVTYQWTITNGTINGSSTSNTVNFTATTNPVTLKVKATNASGCSATDFVQVAVTASCTYQLSKSNQAFSASGGGDTVGVTAGVGCAWTASESESWITITGGTPGSGNGNLTYTVSPNTGSARVGAMTIAGQAFTVNQSACTGISVPVTPLSFLKGATSSAISVTTGCAWSASTETSWLHLTTAAGVGNGNVTFDVDANPTEIYRTGSITVGTTSVTITQYGNHIRGDMNGDGFTDLMWRNPVTGANRIWTMNGPVQLGTLTVDTVAGADWGIAGTGDFNGDGMQDIVWRNPATGANSVWFMNRNVRTSYSTLETVVGSNWKIVSVNDWDHDGDPDLVWRNYATGQNSVWIMNGTLRLSVTLLPWVDLAWLLTGSGDANGDGHEDLFWRHSSNGQNSVWYMNGAVRSSYRVLTAIADLNWKIGAIANYSGDGAVDIFWRNTNAASGATALWRLQLPLGDQGVNSFGPTDANVDWQMSGPR